MSISATNNAYQGVLSILSSSADAATNDTESASAKLVDIAKKATSGSSGSSSGTPSDTISLSDDAKTYLSASKSSLSASSSTSSTNTDFYAHITSDWAQDGIAPDWVFESSANDPAQGQAFAQAFNDKDLNVTSVNDIPGLDFVHHGNGPLKNTGLIYDTENTSVQAQYEQAHPGSILVGDNSGNFWYVQLKSSASTSSSSTSTLATSPTPSQTSTPAPAAS